MTDGFVFLDTETTGMEDDARVIDIALVQTSSNGEIEKVYDSLIYGDGSSGGSRLVAIHHITNEMIKNARRFAEVWVEIEPLLRNRIIVAHNELFDRKHINYELAQIGVKPLDEFLCSLKLARFLGLATRKSKTSNGSSGKLEALADRFGFKIESAHRALPDTKALVKVFWKMQEHYPDEVNEFIAHHQGVAVSTLKTLGSSVSNNEPRAMVGVVEKSEEIEIVEDDESNFDATTEGHNFNRLTLPSIDFRNRNLNNASFCQIFGDGANFFGCPLDNSYFLQAQLSNTIFQNVSAVLADFDRAVLRNANFIGANLAGADFQFSDLNGSDFTGANLEDASFLGADLTGTNFTNANLTSANFHNAHLSDTVFLNAIVEDCKLPKGLHNYDFTDINFTEDQYVRHLSIDFPNVDFTRANLQGLNLQDKNFSGADFTEADLSGANLRDADLSYANFTGANLSGADLSDATTDGVSFANTNCHQTIFCFDDREAHEPADFTGAYLFNSDFSNSHLRQTDFSGANLTMANLRDTELFDVTLSFSQLVKARLHATVLDKSTFVKNGYKVSDLTSIDANFLGLSDWDDWSDLIETPSDFIKFFADLGLALSGDFNGWDFSNINLHGNSLQGSNLVECDFSSTDLTSVNLGGTDCTKSTFFRAILVGTGFENANLSKCTFEKATIYDADFTGADLSEANLSSLDLTAMEFSEVDFSKANLVSADFSNSNLSDCCFMGANLNGARFDGADLTNSDFSNATLANGSFQNADLANVNFAGSNLGGANFLGSNVNTRKLRYAKLFNTFMPDGTVFRA